MRLDASRFVVPLFLICSLGVAVPRALPVSQRDSNKTSQSKSKSRSDEFAIKKNALKTPLVNPRIVVSKSKRRLMLYSNNQVVRVYRVGLGTDPVNDKVKEGDRRTPEGTFYIFTKTEHSAY